MKNAVERLRALEWQLDERLQGSRQFSLLAGLAIGGAAHVGTNSFIKRMAKPGSFPQRVGSAIFQKGVRDKAARKTLHPALQRISDVVMGPELSHIYHAGHQSNRTARKYIAMLPENAPGFGGSMKAIVTGRRSPLADRILAKAPLAPVARGTLLRDKVAGGAAAVGMGLVDPVLPLVNIARSKLADSSVGKRVMKGYFKRGAAGSTTGKFGRTLRDYFISPSMTIAEDAGKFARHGVSSLRGQAIPGSGG